MAAYFLPLTNRRPAVSPCGCSRLFGGGVFLGRKRTGPSLSRPVLAGRKPCPVSLRADAALPTFVRHRSGCRFFCVAQKKWNYDGSAKSNVMTRPIPPDHSVDSIFISSDWRERDRSSISSLSRQERHSELDFGNPFENDGICPFHADFFQK